MKRTRVYKSYWDFRSEFGKSEVDKLVVAGSFSEKKSCFSHIEKILTRHSEENRVMFCCQNGSYDFEVFVVSTGKRFAIDIENCKYDFNFANKLRGIRGGRYSEAIATENGLRLLTQDRESLRLVESLIENRHESELFRLVSDGNFRQLPYNEGSSWARDFEFPASLYRLGMEEYFLDPAKPTREEFLLAITAEGINGISEKEISAIKAAQIHVKDQGY